jgi:hypothetical protein
MLSKTLLSGGIGALALGLVATSAQAAPAAGNLPAAGNPAAALERDASGGGLVEKVRRRDRDYDDDYRDRRRYRYRYYRNYHYYRDDDDDYNYSYYRYRRFNYFDHPYYFRDYRHRNW